MTDAAYLHCSDTNLEFDEFSENGLRFCHARVTEVCSILTTNGRFNHPPTYRYESCSKYLLNGSTVRPPSVANTTTTTKQWQFTPRDFTLTEQGKK